MTHRWKITTHHVGASERIVDSTYRWRWQARLRLWKGGKAKRLRLRARIEQTWPDWYVNGQ